MENQLEKDVRRAVENFIVEVERAAQRAVLRIVRSAFSNTDDVVGIVDDPTRPSSLTPLSRTPPRRPLTSDELTVMRAQLVARIDDRPGQTTAELARAMGVPSDRLRPQLRQLADAGVIRIEERFLGGLWRHTYFAADPAHGPRVDASIAPEGAAGPTV